MRNFLHSTTFSNCQKYSENHGFLESHRLLSAQCEHSRYLDRSWIIALFLWYIVVDNTRHIYFVLWHHSIDYVSQIWNTHRSNPRQHIEIVLFSIDLVVYVAVVIDCTFCSWDVYFRRCTCIRLYGKRLNKFEHVWKVVSVWMYIFSSFIDFKLHRLKLNWMIFVFPFQIVAAVLTCISFLFSIWLVVKERHYLLPSLPASGHGLVLLVFWTLAFTNENVSIMNLNKEHWWNNVNASLRDKVELSLFIARYICSLLIFVLGIKAPGIVHNVDDEYIHLDQENNSVSLRPTDIFISFLRIIFAFFLNYFQFSVIFVLQQENRSTWTSAWKKIRTLAPFLWPKKSVALQLRVILCFVLLIGGRVLNVLVPIYNQKIGNFHTFHNQISSRC